VIVVDVATSPVFVGKPTLDILLAADVRAVQSTPLVSRSGRIVGMFSTHYCAPRRPAARDLWLLDMLARQAADIIKHRQSEAAREEIRARIAKSEKALSEWIERAPFGIYVVDAQFRVVRMNRGSQKGLFRNVRPMIGHDLAEAIRILGQRTCRGRNHRRVPAYARNRRTLLLS
jgi:GAF domain-containing protein